MITDAELALAARGGSEPAFTRLVERHQARLRAFLRRTLGASREEADDVAQETFVAAWAGLARLREPGGFRPWLFGIGWKKAQDRLRSGRRAMARDTAWLEEADTPRGIAPEDRMALAAAMAELPADVRACVSLCLADGFSNGEAAMALGLPLGTVKSHVLRGRKRLLVALGGSDDA